MESVIPAEAGIQQRPRRLRSCEQRLDPRFRGSDNLPGFGARR
jgi:hypothetical protein